MPAQVWVFYRDAVGVYADRSVDLSLLTPAQRAEYDAHTAEIERETPPWAHEQDQPAPRFPNIRLAMRYARLEDEEESIAEEMHAYYAPSECGELAYSSLRERRERLMQWAVA